MTDRVTQLYQANKIDELSYRAYITFMFNDMGRDFLKSMLTSIVMEEPPMSDQMSPTLFIWHDGRRSVWRDIKKMIDNIDYLLEHGT